MCCSVRRGDRQACHAHRAAARLGGVVTTTGAPAQGTEDSSIHRASTRPLRRAGPRLWLLACCVLLAFAPFATAPGDIIADTKFELAVNRPASCPARLPCGTRSSSACC